MYFDDNKLILLEIIIQLIYKISGLSEEYQVQHEMRKIFLHQETTQRTRREIKSKCIDVVILYISVSVYFEKGCNGSPKNSWDITLT